MDAPLTKQMPREALAEWLEQALRSGRVPAAQIHQAAFESGHNRSTLMRVKTKMGIVSERDGYGEGGIWYWRLPTRDAGI